MANLIEDEGLRDRNAAFEDRAEAGRLLAARLSPYAGGDCIVLGIPSGGVPVAVEIAGGLGLELDLVIVRKIQIPYYMEAGFGAVGPDGEVFLNKFLLSHLNLSEEDTEEQIEKTREIVRERDIFFRQGRAFPEITGRTVILVDDGLASGFTMLSALEFVKRHRPGKTVIAVPTAAESTVSLLLGEVDELYCLNVRGEQFFAVADAYRNWCDVREEEALAMFMEFSAKGR